MAQDQSIRDVLNRRLAINLGLLPGKTPKGLEEIRLFRICINMLRQAEIDYLSDTTPQSVRATAAQTLFGLHLSTMPIVCRLLRIDPIGARLKIIEWKMKGMIGDPVFDFLNDPRVANQYEMGKITDFSSAEDEYEKAISDL